MSQPVTPAAPKAAKEKAAKVDKKAAAVTPLATGAPVKEAIDPTPVTTVPETIAPTRTGGVTAPEQTEQPSPSPGTTEPGTTSPPSSGGTAPQSGTAAPEQGTPSGSSGSGAQSGSGGDPSAPPSEH
jgi:hypothetical protein